MRVLLLAAGLGTRLRPLTETIPKCLVPIKGKPLLEIWLERLTHSGMGPFLVNTNYLSEQVEVFIDQNIHKSQVSLVYEPELRGTAGTLIQNLKFFQGKDGLLIHADNYCMADFNAFEKAHLQRPMGCVMTMMTFRTDEPCSCGIVELDDRGVVVGFHEKVLNPPGNLSSGAIYILSNEMLEILSSELHMVKDFSTEVIHRFLGRIYSYETSEVFLDIGTIENYKKINM